MLRSGTAFRLSVRESFFANYLQVLGSGGSDTHRSVRAAELHAAVTAPELLSQTLNECLVAPPEAIPVVVHRLASLRKEGDAAASDGTASVPARAAHPPVMIVEDKTTSDGAGSSSATSAVAPPESWKSWKEKTGLTCTGGADVEEANTTLTAAAMEKDTVVDEAPS